MNSRELFLNRVRAALRTYDRPGARVDIGPRGHIGYQGGGTDPVAGFLGQFASAGGNAFLVENKQSAHNKTIEIIQQLGPQRILIGQAQILEALGLYTSLSALGLTVIREREAGDPAEPEAFFAADMGISGTDYLIAETGSLVMHFSESQSRSLSLLPPLHLVIAETNQIVPDLFDYFELQARPAGRMPSCVTLITGPSKTGDIEMQLVTGVHGPAALYLVLIRSANPLGAGKDGSGSVAG
jgi:L-lactate dehydrogenase complex protein LldG